MALSEQDIFELQDLYKRLFYKSYSPNDYRFLGVQFIKKESEPVILTGSSNNSKIFCIANTTGIIQVCDSFEDAKREIGI